MNKTIICIDPGESGAIAVQWELDGKVTVDNMPETMTDIWDFFLGPYRKPHAYLENVGGYREGNSGPSSVKFSRHIGHLEMALYAAGIPTEKVAPNTWMRSLGVPKLEKQDRKRWIKDYVQRAFPALKVTLSNADALGMLLYVQRKG